MSDQKKRQVPILVSLPTYLIMYVGSAWAVFFPLGLTGSAKMLPFFALGLSGFSDSSSGYLVTALLIVGNVIFLAFLVFLIRARSWSTFGALCCGFAVFLLLNFVGWHIIASDLDNESPDGR